MALSVNRWPCHTALVMLGLMPDTFFDEWIAQRYEALWPELRPGLPRQAASRAVDAHLARRRLGRQLGDHHARAAGDILIAEWLFACIWRGKPGTFEGASVARLTGGKISYLREYATTAPLYDWMGTWRE